MLVSQERAIKVDSGVLETMLKKHDVRERLAIGALGVLGAILLPLGPALLACVSWAMQERRNFGQANWFTHFFYCSLVMIPLGFWLSRRGAGRSIEHSAEEFGEMNFLVRRNLIGYLMLHIFSVLGPGLIWKVIRRSRSLAQHSHINHSRAAIVLSSLLKLDGGTDPLTIKGTEQWHDDLPPIFSYLLAYEWIDLNKAGDRVWATTRARERVQLQ